MDIHEEGKCTTCRTVEGTTVDDVKYVLHLNNLGHIEYDSLAPTFGGTIYGYCQLACAGLINRCKHGRPEDHCILCNEKCVHEHAKRMCKLNH